VLSLLRGSASRFGGLAAVVFTAVLLGVYARGGLGFAFGLFALVPWLLALDSLKSFRAAALSGLLMSMAMVLAVFAWFGTAIGAYIDVPPLASILLLVVLAPLLQPQLLVFALVRHWAGRRFGALLRALAGASAWVACEWVWPKLLGDTLGHGLFPSAVLRQMADLAGAAGLTLVLILVNEALVEALARGRQGLRAAMRPLALASVLILLPVVYGSARLAELRPLLAEPAPALRVGLVQSGIVDYERLRREMGAYAVVRNVLDTHYAMSQAAMEQHAVDVLLWSETVYPTPFGHPRSEDGAELDRELLGFVEAVGVPLVFGTYDLDDAGEYNAAAFIEPGRGLLGYYRKTHPFPLTEHVPAWLDGPRLRRWLPWAGSWQPGNGARVFPLRTARGVEVNVLPLICLDAVRPQLAIDGARLGAQAILGLSNDSWFSDYPLGAELHLAVAAFRSIETRLPQLRVTSNGMSALIDETGEVLVSTAMGDQAVLAGQIPARDPVPTLMVRWGDWLGAAALLFVLSLAVGTSLRSLAARRRQAATAARGSGAAGAEFAAVAVLLSAPWRTLLAALRFAAGLGLLALLWGMLRGDGLQVQSIAQIWLFAAAVVAPALAAWALQRAFAAKLTIQAGALVLEQGAQRIEIELGQLTAVRIWWLPLPGSGVDLELGSAQRWKHGLQLADPEGLRSALQHAGAPLRPLSRGQQRRAHFASARADARVRWLDAPLIKFGLFSLLLALPAFRLHQNIAFGGSFGEYYSYGLGAYLAGLLIWWASWAIGLMLAAAALRVAIELCAASALLLSLRATQAARPMLEWTGRLLFYLGIIVWLLLRLLVDL